MIFRECDLCGASLDPGERCNCREEAEAQKRKADADHRASVTGMLMATTRGKKKKP